jgi:heat shock protein HslJ
MRTDEQLDEQLRAAGARWRVAQQAADGERPARPYPVPARRLRRWPRAVAVAAAVAVIAAGVGWAAADRDHSAMTGPPAAGAAIAGSWTLQSWVSADGAQHAPARRATLRLAADRLSGSDGCNQLAGSASVGAGVLDVGQLSSTLMACPDGDLQASVIRAVLTGPARYRLTAGELTISRAGAGALTYRRAASPSVDPAVLTANRWALTTIEQTSANSSTGSGSSDYAEATLRFDGAAHAVLENACGAGEVAAAVSAGRLVFDAPPVPALPACPRSALPAQQWAAVARVLTGTVSWQIQGETLAITRPGVGALTFTRV